MRILLLGQNWLQQELQERGHQVFSISTTSSSTDLKLPQEQYSMVDLLKSTPFEFDCLVYWDNSVTPWVTNLTECRRPMLYYAVDVHLHHRWQPQFSAVFDKVLVAQRDFLPLFYRFSPEAEWMPLWATLKPPQVELPREITVSFVGNLDAVNHPERVAFFDKVKQDLELSLLRGDYRETYARSKMVLNHSVSGDLNFRVFEAMSCGAALVTPRIENGLLELFEEGRDLICYQDGSAEDAVARIKELLSGGYEQIARNARAKVEALHLSTNRALQLETYLENLTHSPKPLHYYGGAYGNMVSFLTAEPPESKPAMRSYLAAKADLMRVSEISNREQTGVVIILTEYTARNEGVEYALTFLEHFRRKSPENRVIKLAIVQKLLQLGRKERAVELAAEVSTDPARTCEDIHREMELALGEME
jgi:hypothetical protein